MTHTIHIFVVTIIAGILFGYAGARPRAIDAAAYAKLHADLPKLIEARTNGQACGGWYANYSALHAAIRAAPHPRAGDAARADPGLLSRLFNPWGASHDTAAAAAASATSLAAAAAAAHQRYAVMVSAESGLADRLTCSLSVMLYGLLTGRAFEYVWLGPHELWRSLPSPWIDWRAPPPPPLPPQLLGEVGTAALKAGLPALSSLANRLNAGIAGGSSSGSSGGKVDTSSALLPYLDLEKSCSSNARSSSNSSSSSSSSSSGGSSSGSSSGTAAAAGASGRGDEDGSAAAAEENHHWAAPARSTMIADFYFNNRQHRTHDDAARQKLDLLFGGGSISTGRWVKRRYSLDLLSYGREYDNVVWSLNSGRVWKAAQNPKLRRRLQELGIPSQAAAEERLLPCLFNFLYVPSPEALAPFAAAALLDVLLDPANFVIGIQVRVGDWVFAAQQEPQLQEGNLTSVGGAGHRMRRMRSGGSGGGAHAGGAYGRWSQRRLQQQQQHRQQQHQELKAGPEAVAGGGGGGGDGGLHSRGGSGGGVQAGGAASSSAATRTLSSASPMWQQQSWEDVLAHGDAHFDCARQLYEHVTGGATSPVRAVGGASARSGGGGSSSSRYSGGGSSGGSGSGGSSSSPRPKLHKGFTLRDHMEGRARRRRYGGGAHGGGGHQAAARIGSSRALLSAAGAGTSSAASGAAAVAAGRHLQQQQQQQEVVVDPRRVYFLLLSDSTELRRQAEAQFGGGGRLLVPQGLPIEHVQDHAHHGQAGLHAAAAELWLFGLASAHVVTQSSAFGRLGALAGAGGTRCLLQPHTCGSSSSSSSSGSSTSSSSNTGSSGGGDGGGGGGGASSGEGSAGGGGGGPQPPPLHHLYGIRTSNTLRTCRYDQPDPLDLVANWWIGMRRQ